MRTSTTKEQREAPTNGLKLNTINPLVVIRKIGFLETDELEIWWLFSWNDGKQKAVYYCVFTCSWASVSPSRLCNPASFFWALLNYKQLKIRTTNILLLFLFVCLEQVTVYSECNIIHTCSSPRALSFSSWFLRSAIWFSRWRTWRPPASRILSIYE